MLPPTYNGVLGVHGQRASGQQKLKKLLNYNHEMRAFTFKSFNRQV